MTGAVEVLPTAADAKVVNLDAFRDVPLKVVSLDAFPEATSAELLAQARDRIAQAYETATKVVLRALLPVADTLVRAKAVHEAETGTGHGKRNPDGTPSFVEVAAEALDRSPSFVERLLKLAQLDGKTREMVDGIPRLAANQDALLALAREPSPERRHLAVGAFRSGGRSAMNRVLDPGLADFERDDHDQDTTLGFFTGYQEAQQARAAAEDRDRELRRHEESRATKRRRANAKAVFESLRDGETTLDADTLERIGLTRAQCDVAVKDLIHSGLIDSTGSPDTFEALDDVVFGNQYEPAPKRTQTVRVVVPVGAQVPLKLKGVTYEVGVIVNGGGSVEVVITG
jgi:hypothetical protein